MKSEQLYGVLLIEDDPMVQEVNRQFVEQSEGYQVVGIAGNGAQGLRMIEELKPDLVFLDIFMPSLDGIATLQRIRSLSLPVDVVVVTAARDTETVSTMMRNGAFDYIIKPFKLERIQQTLNRYRTQFAALRQEGKTVSQEELDQLLLTTGDSASSREADLVYVSDEPPLPSVTLPKGLNPTTLKQVLAVMRQQGGTVSAEETAVGVGIARVTARRYLDFLEKRGFVRLGVHYGGIGRPVNRYELHHKQNDQK